MPAQCHINWYMAWQPTHPSTSLNILQSRPFLITSSSDPLIQSHQISVGRNTNCDQRVWKRVHVLLTSGLMKCFTGSRNQDTVRSRALKVSLKRRNITGTRREQEREQLMEGEGAVVSACRLIHPLRCESACVCVCVEAGGTAAIQFITPAWCYSEITIIL